MRLFTKDELASCDGKDGRPAYIVCAECVYDVSASFHWRGGRHHAMHSCGEDLTESLASAPHGFDSIRKFPMVGMLKLCKKD